MFHFFRHSDCCGSCSNEKENNLRKKTGALIAIIIGFVLFVSNFFISFNFSQSLILNIIAYFLVGKNVLFQALKSLLKFDFFNENTLMTLATLGAFFTDQFPEAVGIMLFYRIGEYLQDASVSKSRKNIKSLLALKPDYANLKLSDGSLKQIDPNLVKIDDIIVVKVGERIPLDGIVLTGTSLLDTSALTGESIPRLVEPGGNVLSGVINKKEVLEIKVTTAFFNSTINKILNLIENASQKKTITEKFMTRFARIYTPCVFFLALCVYLIPTLLGFPSHIWLNRALIFLLISCPCALVLSIPLGFFTGIGVSSRQGILIKGTQYLEIIPKIKNIVFDKTGTLTKGSFEVVKITCFDITEKELLDETLEVERLSNHPIALSIVQYYTQRHGEFIEKHKETHQYKEIEGMGMILTNRESQKKITVGNEKLFLQEKIDLSLYSQTLQESITTKVFLAVNNKLKGIIEIEDSLRENAKETILTLGKYKINPIILTGDTQSIAQKVAEKLSISSFYANLLPQDKVSYVEEIKKTGLTAFVGDGVNDAPVLALSDIGIAMGGIGSDAAIEAADVVLVTDDIKKITTLIQIARKTLKIVNLNIFLALGIKILFMIFGIFGIVTIWEAIFADVGVTLLTVLNCSFILLHKK